MRSTWNLTPRSGSRTASPARRARTYIRGLLSDKHFSSVTHFPTPNSHDVCQHRRHLERVGARRTRHSVGPSPRSGTNGFPYPHDRQSWRRFVFEIGDLARAILPTEKNSARRGTAGERGGSQTPRGGRGAFESQISNPKSQIPNLKSQISNPKSQIPNPKSQIPNPKSQISNLKSQISNLKSQIPNPKSQIPNPKSQIQIRN